MAQPDEREIVALMDGDKVVGTSTRAIGYRFPQDVISNLLVIRWWQWDDRKIKREADTLIGPIIECHGRN